jgi:hypothetical protein
MNATLTKVVTYLLFGIGFASAAQPPRWTAEVAMDSQIFPSLVYSMANLREDNVIVGQRKVRRMPSDFAGVDALARRPFVVHFSSLAPGSKASIRVKCDGVIEPASALVDLGRSQRVYVPVTFLHDNLVRNRQPKPASLEFLVSIDGGPVRRVTKPITVRSINDCPYFFVTSKTAGRGIDLAWMFAAYVNEDHPMVDEVLKIALSTGIVRSFTGYQTKDIDEVRNQVRAIWTALSMMGIRYSSITASSNRSEIALSQHVRLVGESSKANQANCADGSVLIASILEKIGIETELIKVPGHMYVRFWLDPWEGDKKHWCCLETTVIGDGFPPPKSPRSQALQAADTSNVRAWTDANKSFDKVRENFTPDSSDFKIINIAEARRRGIIPIPYLSSK